jgi:hypothetical protein
MAMLRRGRSVSLCLVLLLAGCTTATGRGSHAAPQVVGGEWTTTTSGHLTVDHPQAWTYYPFPRSARCRSSAAISAIIR